MTKLKRGDIIALEAKKGCEDMSWSEMSYKKYNQAGLADIEPEVWDEIYEPTDEQYMAWGTEKQES